MMSSTSSAGQSAGVLRGLAAGLVEEGRHGDHDLADRPEPALGVLLQPFEHEGAEDLGRDVLADDLAVVGRAAHVALEALGEGLGREHRALDRLLADDDPSSSKTTALGVSRSPVPLSTVVGRPVSSRYATTE